ncbi:MAG TPA: coenzyme F420-0:L-glutamate ligase [Chloroflexota bacterium]|nr:coenzyme F420-0:L-glutamate ligase [Chloroflexota bacterium]
MLEIVGLRGFPEVRAGDDLGTLTRQSLRASGRVLQDGDVLVFTSKIVSKAEGRVVDIESVEPSGLASTWASQFDKDARLVEVVLQQARRVARMDRGVLIAETQHGFICANAGVDRSNTGGAGEAILLPEDPDASARRLRRAMLEPERSHEGHSPEGSASRGTAAPTDIAVIISDTFGRAWRLGQTNVAIGAAGIRAVHSYVGQQDPNGMTLHSTGIAVIDELAGAAELVMGKLDRVPVALVRGYDYPRIPEGMPDEGASALVRNATMDLFR